MGLLRSPSRQLDRAVYKAHQEWLRAGGMGPGRLIAEDEPLLGIVATAARLDGIRFVRCLMRKGNLSNSSFRSALLVGCDLAKINLYMATFRSATVKDCTMVGACLTLATIAESTVTSCDLTGIHAPRLWIRDSTVEHVIFKSGMLLDAFFEGNRFLECDFRDANFARAAPSPGLGITRSSHFEHCDFRGVDFTGRVIQDCTFTRCLFHGTTGVPELGDGIVMDHADLSPDGDGSEILDAHAGLERWSRGALSEPQR